jgi:lysophospholipase L1-like esterase
MSGRKILLFLLSVYAILAVVCLLFPANGIAIAGTTLNFPTLSDVREALAPSKVEATPSPEELLQQRMKAIHDAEKQKFETYFAENPARIYFPDGDVSIFDPFFAALDSARSRQMRILHYGDSQIEEDRITGTVRKGLQERFGGSGPGLLPFGNPYYTLNYSLTSSASLHKSMIFSDGDRRSDSRYGIMGQCSRMDTSVFTTVAPSKHNTGPTRGFSRLTLLAGNIGGSVNLKCGSASYKLDPVKNASGVERIVVDLPDSSTRVRFSTWGSADVYGIQLDDTLGVCVDNIPMRSCSGTIFTRINSSQLREYMENDNVRLIILQFGGNAMPYRKTGQAISEYKQSIEKQIRHIRGLAPHASILFIGPSDMSTNVRGKMQTYPHLPMMVDSLKAAANDAGAAYWDMYGAMGGDGSMVEWVKARPQLAGNDYVHFTPKGAEAVGDMLFETLMLYYDWYRLRKYGPAK